MTYFVTFRHRRELDEAERRELLRALLQPEGKRWDLLVACVLPGSTELLLTLRSEKEGVFPELSRLIEGAKTRAGRRIVAKTGERFAPFFGESYDRIVRDEAELETRWLAMVGAPESAGLGDDYETLWVSGAIES